MEITAEEGAVNPIDGAPLGSERMTRFEQEGHERCVKAPMHPFAEISTKYYGHRPSIGYDLLTLGERTPVMSKYEIVYPAERVVADTFEELETLVTKLGIDINHICCMWTRYTILHLASASGDVDIADHVLSLGADVDVQAWDGSTPLMLAIKKQHYEVVSILIDAGADINICAVRHVETERLARPYEYIDGLVDLLRPKECEISPLGEAISQAIVKPSEISKEILRIVVEGGAIFDWTAYWVNTLGPYAIVIMENRLAEAEEYINKSGAEPSAADIICKDLS